MSENGTIAIAVLRGRTALAAAMMGSTALSLGMIATPATAQAQTTAEYSIPAGSLATVLNRFADQSGTEIIYDGSLTEGLSSAGLSGRFSAIEALSRILAGTSLTFRQTGSRSFTLDRAPPTADGAVQLGPVRVEGSGGSGYASLTSDSAATEGTGSYTTRSMSTSTKLSLSPRETPQSVTVLTSQMIKDQNLISLDDAINNIPGLVMRKGDLVGNSGTFSARGFDIDNMMIDGLPISLLPVGTLNGDNEDLSIYDRVEVVRGSAGLTIGSGNPSAAINLIRKRPTLEPSAALSGTVGSWNDFRLVADGSTPLNRSKSLRIRMVSSIQDKDNFYDGVHENIKQVYGIAEYDLAASTMITLGANWRDQHNDGVYTRQPTNPDGSFLDVPRSANFGNDFDYWDQESKTLFSELKHNFGDGWAVNLSAIKRWQDIDVTFSGFNRSAGILYQNTQRYVMERDDTTLDLNGKGPFTLFNREHELAFGVSHRRNVLRTDGGWPAYAYTPAAPVVDVYNWDSSAVPKPAIDLSIWSWDNTSKQTGAYAVGRINIADPVKLIVGTRVDWYEILNEDTNVNFKSKTQITPYAGIILDLNKNYSLYASWTEIFQPQTAFDKNGSVLAPITGTNIEAGIKGEYLEGRLNASVAVFQIRQRNRAVDDLSGPNPCPPYNLYGACQRASGEVKVQGAEFEISGELAPGWQMMAGYTYTTSKFVTDDDPTKIGTPLDPRYPEHQFKLSTSYKVTDNLRVGGNVYYQSKTQAYWTNLISQGSYIVMGLNAEYRFNENLDARINLNNVLDEHYFQNLGAINSGNQPGQPRSFYVTLNWRL